jgi:hypothetical protein
MRLVTLACAGLIGVVTTGSVCAQETDEAAVRLRDQLRRGDRVTLSLTDMVIEGKLLAIEPDALRVQTAKGQSRVPFTAIDEASRKRMSFLRGLIIGAGVGAAWGVLGAMLGEMTDDDRAAAVAGSTAFGAGIGIGIDAMLNRKRTVYRRGVKSHVSLSPTLAPRLAEMRVSVTW